MVTMHEWMENESAKRLRNWDPAVRWQVLQQTITWAEQQATVRRNTPAACLREQQRKLSQMTSAGHISAGTSNVSVARQE